MGPGSYLEDKAQRQGRRHDNLDIPQIPILMSLRVTSHPLLEHIGMHTEMIKITEKRSSQQNHNTVSWAR